MTEVAAEEAKRLFSRMGVQITTEGKRLREAAIGNTDFEEKFTETIISPLVQQVPRLSEVAQTQPQAAHVAFTHGPIGKWTFLISYQEHLAALLNTVSL